MLPFFCCCKLSVRRPKGASCSLFCVEGNLSFQCSLSRPVAGDDQSRGGGGGGGILLYSLSIVSTIRSSVSSAGGANQKVALAGHSAPSVALRPPCRRPRWRFPVFSSAGVCVRKCSNKLSSQGPPRQWHH